MRSFAKVSTEVDRIFMSIKRITDEELFLTDEKIGRGVFGVCFLGSLGPLHVCAKVFKSACLCESAFRYEAALLSICSHTNIPWLYGIVMQSRKIIVTSYHAVNGKPLTLHQTLNSRSCTIVVNWKMILLGMASAIQYIHSKSILHNDIKSDNIILDSQEPNSYRSLLIDFGKGCFFGDARLYSLTEDEKKSYANEHPQVAPEVRDGRVKQGVYSDVYSLGRVIYQVNEKILNCSELSQYCNNCIQSDHSARPTSSDVHQFLSSLAL